ncbi:MAG TPA: POTRA domain-containing protein [Acidobacteriaceae bacterium]|nr:POTRA domain-containing protein [Acidobacteriaceae bacterium]
MAVLTSSSAVAQYSVAGLRIHGAAPFTDAEVLQVSGLKPGLALDQKSLQRAAQNLLDTGVFADASVSLTGMGMARTVVMDLKPVPAALMVPASFTNLVWWTPAELRAELEKRVPLFREAIPPAGTLAESVTAALTSMLAEKGVRGTVVNVSVAPTSQHPVATWEFRLDDPSVRLGSAELTGMPSEFVAPMQKVLRQVTGSAYNEGLSGSLTSDLLLTPLRGAGYVDAQLALVSRSVSASADGFVVKLNATVVLGALFHVSSLTWQPTAVYSQDAFTHEAKLHGGEVASEGALLGTEQAIVNAYLRQGYLDAYVDAHSHEDAAAHTVSYSLQIVPGEVYHLRTVIPMHLTPEAQKDFQSGWTMQPGAVYDPLYAANFLNNNTALRALSPYTALFQAAADTNTHLVDLTINFVRAGH